MKATNVLSILAALLLLPLYFTSCGVDRWKEYAEETASARWIEDTMRVWYYWADQMPSDEKLNYFGAPESFFRSLLFSEDRFSVIDSLRSGASPTSTRSIPDTDYSYGFQFSVGRVQGRYCAHLLYVVPSSPADEAGLERGDFIFAINDEPLSDKSALRLYGDDAVALTVGKYDMAGDSIALLPAPVQIASARVVDDNPVHYYNVYTDGLNRVGYLVYNHFSYAPTTTGGNEYDNALRQAFAWFASQQVNEFVLDLRYNNGGYVSSAQLLATMLAPASALGQPMATMEYGPQREPQTEAFIFNEGVIGSGANLNLKRLYVLTSTQTASASELIINCLRPYMEVVLVGSTTVGKNVGSIAFDNPQLMLTMSPIVCQLYNAQGQSDYANGFPADHPVDENDNLALFLPLGDPNEAMLGKALTVIAKGGADVPDEGEGGEGGDGESTVSKLQLAPVFGSIERRASGAVRIR